LEPRTYKVDLLEAIAAAEAIELDHRRIFIDPQYVPLERLDARVRALRRRHQRLDLLLNAIGVLALLLLLMLSWTPL
jgi:hypothetical protein